MRFEQNAIFTTIPIPCRVGHGETRRFDFLSWEILIISRFSAAVSALFHSGGVNLFAN